MTLWAAERGFPEYTYVPGRGLPHPVRDPRGHSYGRPEPHVAHWDPAQWQQCEVYLRGVDLLNHGFFWEAHEQWEAIWRCTSRQSWDRNLLSALIKLAAAGVKFHEGRPIGVRRHLDRSLELLQAASDRLSAISTTTRPLGMDLNDVRRQVLELRQAVDDQRSPQESSLNFQFSPVLQLNSTAA